MAIKRNILPVLLVILCLLAQRGYGQADSDSLNVIPAFNLENARPPILELKPVFGKDKYDHFIGSAFLTAAGYCVLRNKCEMSHQNALVYSAGISLSFGIGKEVYDKFSKNGHPSWRDILADIAGLALGIGVYSFVN